MAPLKGQVSRLRERFRWSCFEYPERQRQGDYRGEICLHSTALGTRIARVAQDVDDAERGPGSTKDRGCDRVRQASNE